MKRLKPNLAAASLMLGLFTATAPALELPNIFSEHMVLQREIKAPVWGTAAPSATVTVEFAGQKKTTTADASGKWMVRLDSMKANAKPQKMTVSEGANTVAYDDVLVGDNWLCSGQSNMEWDMNGTSNAQAELADVVNYPTIRFFRVADHISKDTPQANAPGKWAALTPDSARSLTAVGYFFGRRINQEVKIPVGIIQSAWGGSAIEPWTTYTGWEKGYLDAMEKWLPEARAALKAGRALPGAPPAPNTQANGGMYNGMIAPLAPYAIKGALWYQGESNGGEGVSYFHKMESLINGWRAVFQSGQFPFYYVQLANFQNPNPNAEGGDGWAKVREAQRKALEIPNTGMAVAIDLADIGNPGDIHPKNKQDVGSRLAQWALVQTYGRKDLVPSGPLFKSAASKGGKLHVSFEHTGKGLIVGEKRGLDPVKEVTDGKLKGFAIAGADKKWAWADAVIDGKTVVLSSSDVPEPVAVRYGFSMNPDAANLYNKEGLPASPFRSDDW